MRKSLALAGSGIIPFLGACDGPYSALDPAGPAARDAAALWWGMALFSIAVLVAVAALWLHAMYRDPAKGGRIGHRHWIIGGGVLLPSGSIAALLAFGIPAGHRMLPLDPADGEVVVVEVTGHMWWWEVRYPGTDIRLVDELHIPAGVPVNVELTSADVIHSFWVPQLAGKLDMIPGQTNVIRLQADRAGTFRGHCAEFCGQGHAEMRFVVHAHEPEDFEAWLAEAGRGG